MKKIFITASIIGMFALGALAVEQQRVAAGWGVTVTAGTNVSCLTIEQPEGSDIVSNGTFASTNYWILGSDWSVSGNTAIFTSTNMVQNGTFATTNNWVTNTYWATTSGVATFQSTVAMTDDLVQAMSPISNGFIYRVQYTVSGVDAGTVTPVLGTGTTGTSRNANGTYSETLTAVTTTTGTNFIFRAITADAGTVKVDNVSMQINGKVTTNSIYQSITNLQLGTKYRLRYTVADIDNGTNTLKAKIGSTYISTVSTNGSYTEDIPCFSESNITFEVISTNNSSLAISAVSLRETPDTAFVTDAKFKISATDLPVYFLFNCDGTTFSNAYDTSRALMVDSNESYTASELQGGDTIRKIWYRTSSGTATMNINGR